MGTSVSPWVAAHALEFFNADRQGLTLVHFSAQSKRFMWDRGCVH